MKKTILICILLAFLSIIYAVEYTLKERINRYSGKNATALNDLLVKVSPDTLKYVQFLLDNASPLDLAVLTPDFVMMNIRQALKTKELSYTKEIPDDLFMHFVLTPRISQEPFEEWRPVLYMELFPIIKDCTTLEEAAFLVNLWSAEKMAFKPTNGRDQTPLTTIRRGYGRCEEMMILYMAASRSVGIPCRPASAPYWNFTDNNHAWTDVWTTGGWKFIGAAEAANRLGETWFAETTTRATLVLSEAYGNFSSPQKVKYENGVTTLATTGDYTQTVKVTLHITDEKGNDLPQAKVMLYGATYGGEMPMLSLEADEKGIVRFPLGKGGVWVTAYGDSLFGCSLLNTMNGDVTMNIRCSSNTVLNECFNIHFPLPAGRSADAYGPPIINDFEHLRELSNLRRENRLNSYKHTIEFLNFYDTKPDINETDSSYIARRDAYARKCEQLAGNADIYRTVFAANRKMKNAEARRDLLCKMIEDWDIKELVELPDSSSIQAIVDLYLPSKLAYPDSLWRKNILDPVFSTPPCPENGWESRLFSLIHHLQGVSNTETMTNLLTWVDSVLVIDDDIVYSYFSGSITPLDYLNMYHVPASGRTILLACALKLVQVPIRWKGYLEYFDGKQFLPVDIQKDSKEGGTRKLRTITLSLVIDGKKTKASAYENYFLAAMTEKGTIDDAYFDQSEDGTECTITYPEETGIPYYLEGMTRNDNGDVQVAIKSIRKDQDKYRLELVTPKNYFEATARWSAKTRKDITHLARKWASHGGSKLVFVRAPETTEPQQRMLTEILDKNSEFAAKNCEILIYTEQRSNDDIPKLPNLQMRSGMQILSEKMIAVDYPAVFLIGSDNQILFSSRGYQMGMGSLLLKKIK